jgi:hypothetical protein
MGRGEGKGVKGAYAKEEWMGGKEVGESVMGCKIYEMEMGKSGWERRDWGEREKGKLKEQEARSKGHRAREQDKKKAERRQRILSA